MSFPDTELVLMDALAGFGHCVTSTPPNLLDLLESGLVHRIQRVGGGSTEDEDHPRISVQTFAQADYADPRAAHNGAAAIRDHLVETKGLWVTGPLLTAQGMAGVLLDDVEHVSGPVPFPWPDATVQVVQMIYTATIRL